MNSVSLIEVIDITGGRESNSVESLYFCIWIAAPK
jgi:hypothetical protein